MLVTLNVIHGFASGILTVSVKTGWNAVSVVFSYCWVLFYCCRERNQRDKIPDEKNVRLKPLHHLELSSFLPVKGTTDFPQAGERKECKGFEATAADRRPILNPLSWVGSPAMGLTWA